MHYTPDRLSCCRFSTSSQGGTGRREGKGASNRLATHGSGGLGGGRSDEGVRTLFDTKVSKDGSPDALFQDCIDAIRRKRASLHQDGFDLRGVKPNAAITQLKEDELEITRKIFRRVDPERDVTSDVSHGGHHIDPYWDPFHRVRGLKEQVTAEFDEYSKFMNVAEQKRIRSQIKLTLRKMSQVHNPYSQNFRKYHERSPSEQPPKPFHLPDKHWEPSPLQARLARERITWRDVDIIQHFLADNGYILPRRTTMLRRPQQKKLVKAVKQAQMMSLIPYNGRPQDYHAMPLTDPLQWMADRLTDRVVESQDLRSRAMMQVMIERYPDLNYGRFLRHEASSTQGTSPQPQQ